MVLMVNNLTGFGTGNSSGLLIDIINELGLATSLNCCLDAGDIISYPGAGTNWIDRSGNGNTFFRNSTGAAFNGVAGTGGESNYFSFDGASFWVEQNAQTFTDNWHKNNGAFTVIVLYYPLATKVNPASMFANRSATNSDAGVHLFVTAAGALDQERSITTTTSDAPVGMAGVSLGGWNFLAWSYDEAGPSCTGQINSTQSSITVLASTDTDAPVNTNHIGSRGNELAGFLESGERMMMWAAWSRALSDAELNNLYVTIKSRRVGSLP